MIQITHIDILTPDRRTADRNKVYAEIRIYFDYEGEESYFNVIYALSQNGKQGCYFAPLSLMKEDKSVELYPVNGPFRNMLLTAAYRAITEVKDFLKGRAIPWSKHYQVRSVMSPDLKGPRTYVVSVLETPLAVAS